MSSDEDFNVFDEHFERDSSSEDDVALDRHLFGPEEEARLCEVCGRVAEGLIK